MLFIKEKTFVFVFSKMKTFGKTIFTKYNLVIHLKIYSTISATINHAKSANAEGLRHTKGSIFCTNADRHIGAQNTEAVVRRTNAAKRFAAHSPKCFKPLWLLHCLPKKLYLYW